MGTEVLCWNQTVLELVLVQRQVAAPKVLHRRTQEILCPPSHQTLQHLSGEEGDKGGRSAGQIMNTVHFNRLSYFFNSAHHKQLYSAPL